MLVVERVGIRADRHEHARRLEVVRGGGEQQRCPAVGVPCFAIRSGPQRQGYLVDVPGGRCRQQPSISVPALTLGESVGPRSVAQ